MEWKTLSKNSITVWKVRYSILAIILCFILGSMAIFSISIFFVLILLTIIFYMFLIFKYCVKKFANTKYNISTQEIVIIKGVYFSNKVVLNKSRIQYIELTQSPLQKFFNICNIMFHTAGPKIILEQIPTKTALNIKKDIYGD